MCTFAKHKTNTITNLTMKTITTFLLCFCLSVAQASAASWNSKATGTALNCTVTDSPSPAKDASGRFMTVVYLENLSCEKIGQNTLQEDVSWLLGQGYRVIELDYANHAKAVAPDLTKDIIAINDELNSGTFCGAQNISNTRAYILFEGYRLHRDVSYAKDDPSVYNFPDGYVEGDSLYMDIAYPANPSRPVPTVLSFSYSNSYHGKTHQRMFLGYTLAMFDDAIQEMLPASGMAWAIADHPKYCDWGNGKPKGGPGKAYGSIELNPDAGRKAKQAVRVLRHVGKALGLDSRIGVYGFSRGSTAASLLIGDAAPQAWSEGDLFLDEMADVQAAVLGPGVFDYALMPATSNEYKRMTTYCGAYSPDNLLWQQQGGALTIADGACPCFLFYNMSDDAAYHTQMQNLISIFENKGIFYQLLKDYGNGHSVPTTTEHLADIADFFVRNLAVPSAIVQHKADAAANDSVFSLSGQKLSKVPSRGTFIRKGKKVRKMKK